MRTIRRFSTIGLPSTASLPPSRPSTLGDGHSLKRPNPVPTLPEVSKAPTTPATPAPTDSTGSTAPTGSTGSTAPTGPGASAAVKPPRRLSLVERSRMMAKPTPEPMVSGSVRLSVGNRRKSMVLRRPVPAEEKKERPSETPKPKQETVILESPSKKRRYSVVVPQANVVKNQSSYTYMPSSDRRATLDSILQRAMKRGEEGTSKSDGGVARQSFLSSTAYRKPEQANRTSFLNSSSSSLL